MKYKEMQKKWPTLEAYAKDHTAFEVVTSGGAFIAAAVAAAFLVSAVVGLTSWSWFFWAVAVVVVLIVSCTASIAWGKAVKQDMTPTQQETLRKLNEALTPETVDHIMSKMDGYIADRHARFRREVDLPFPRPVIETAFLKAIRDCTDPKKRDVLKSIYITLDEYMLNDEDCALITAFIDFLDQSRSSSMSEMALAKQIKNSLEMEKVLAIKQRLTEAMNRRFELLNKFTGKTE